MWDLDHKKGWVLKNWCFWTVVLERTPASPLDCKEIKPVNLKGNKPWILEGLMLKLKLQYFGYLMERGNSLEMSLILGKIEGRREGYDRGWDGWMPSQTHWTWVWANSDSEGQGNRHAEVHWVCQELDTTEQLNWTDWNIKGSVELVSEWIKWMVLNFTSTVELSSKLLKKSWYPNYTPGQLHQNFWESCQR